MLIDIDAEVLMRCIMPHAFRTGFEGPHDRGRDALTAIARFVDRVVGSGLSRLARLILEVNRE
jgi:hypothetical protein